MIGRNAGSLEKAAWESGRRMWSLKRSSTQQEQWSSGARAVGPKPPMCTRPSLSTAQCSRLVTECCFETVMPFLNEIFFLCQAVFFCGHTNICKTLFSKCIHGNCQDYNFCLSSKIFLGVDNVFYSVCRPYGVTLLFLRTRKTVL